MPLSYYQVDAFTSQVFAGNPAGVCPLDAWLPDSTLQAIAAENNQSETAFYVRQIEGFELRWFTPTQEVDLCGHATLAAAHVLFNETREPGNRLRFSTKSGEMAVDRTAEGLVLDFPTRPAAECAAPANLLTGLGATPIFTGKARDYFAVYATEAEVAVLNPDLTALATLDSLGVIATAPGTDVDFVSRFFAPQAGIPEDPVTGSAHCTLIPYWAERLGKSQLTARQISRRGGELFCELSGDRVRIGGQAVTYLAGSINVFAA